MKAAVLSGPGRLEVIEIPVPRCPDKGVLVKVMACGICAADVKMAQKGHRALVYPRIPGHEIAGVVAESRNRNFKAGEAVQVAPGMRCGICAQCRRGAENQCEKREIIGFTRDGGFAEYIALPLEGPVSGALNRLPESVSYAAATLAEPMACCINAQEKVCVKPGDTVLITGAGPLGLLHGFMARENGAESVIVAETRAHRRKIAAGSWADWVFDPNSDTYCQAVMDATGQKGLDVIILASSGAGLDQNLLNMLAPGGRVSFFSGSEPRISQLRMDANLIHYKEWSFAGAYGCTAAQNVAAIALLATGRVPVEMLITCRVTLDNIQDGFNRTTAQESLKSIVEA